MNEITVDCLALQLATTSVSGEGGDGGDRRKEEQKKVIAGVELAEDTIEEIKEAFLEFDIDSDGTITTQVCLHSRTCYN